MAKHRFAQVCPCKACGLVWITVVELASIKLTVSQVGAAEDTARKLALAKGAVG